VLNIFGFHFIFVLCSNKLNVVNTTFGYMISLSLSKPSFLLFLVNYHNDLMNYNKYQKIVALKLNVQSIYSKKIKLVGFTGGTRKEFREITICLENSKSEEIQIRRC
jgi:hypothetical protein